MKKVIFDSSSKNWVLEIFGKSIDSEGFVVELNNERVLTPEGFEILAEDLAVIKKGSEKFISGDLTSLMKFSKSEI
jgi:hypothetical protein